MWACETLSMNCERCSGIIKKKFRDKISCCLWSLKTNKLLRAHFKGSWEWGSGVGEGSPLVHRLSLRSRVRGSRKWCNTSLVIIRTLKHDSRPTQSLPSTTPPFRMCYRTLSCRRVGANKRLDFLVHHLNKGFRRVAVVSCHFWAKSLCIHYHAVRCALDRAVQPVRSSSTILASQYSNAIFVFKVHEFFF